MGQPAGRAAVSRTVSSLRRRQYRRVLGEARSLGVGDSDIATVVHGFAGENPDPDDVRAALAQYIPPRAFHVGYEDELACGF